MKSFKIAAAVLWTPSLLQNVCSVYSLPFRSSGVNMRALVPLVIMALVQSAIFSVARPVVASPLVNRSPVLCQLPQRLHRGRTLSTANKSFSFCMRIKADAHPSSTFHPRSLATGSLEARKSTNTVLWCAPNSRTYIILTMTRLASGSFVESALDTAAGYVAQYVNQIGDAVINEGSVDFYGGNGVFFNSWNVNNHQQTWGVLVAAIAALKDFMSRNYYGGASFTFSTDAMKSARAQLDYRLPAPYQVPVTGPASLKKAPLTFLTPEGYHSHLSRSGQLRRRCHTFS